MGSSFSGFYFGDFVFGFLLFVCVVCEEEVLEGITNYMYSNISGNFYNFFYVSLIYYKIYKIFLCIYYILLGICNVKCKLWIN